MAKVQIIMDQSGKSAGVPGQSRDDLTAGAVALSNFDNVGAKIWKWELISKPLNSAAELSTPTSSTSGFTVDEVGSYLVRLTINGRIKGTIIGAIKTPNLGLRIPARGETNEFSDGYQWEGALITAIDVIDVNIGGGGGGQTNTVSGSNGITNTGNNVNAVLAPTYGSSANTICQGNDSRLGDARTPTSHATSHKSGGGDSIKLDELAAPDDNANLNATTSAHGLLRKLDNDSGHFLNGQGNWATPAGGGGGNTLDQAYDEGGAGAGRTITVDSGPVELNALDDNALSIDGYITLKEITIPAGIGNSGLLYVKEDVTTKNELFYMDNLSNEVQVTRLGKVYSQTSLDTAYDLGGDAGAGRTITADSGPVVVVAGPSNFCALDLDGYIILRETAITTPILDAGFLHTNDDSGDTELFYFDANGNDVQITKDGQVNASGGSGSLDRHLVFSDDTEFAESGTSYVTKKTFRIVRDSAKKPSSWRLVVSLWIDGGTSAECRLQVGTTDNNTVSSTETTETAASIKKIALTIVELNEVEDTFLTVNIDLKQTGGGTAHLKYTDLYAIYS